MHPFIGTARIDEPPRLKTALVWRNDRVYGITPATAENVDVLHGLGPGAECPQQFIAIPNVDVIVDDDNVTGQKRSRAALRRNRHSLLGMTGITLPDRDDDQQTRLIISNAFYIRYAGFVEVIPYVGRADEIIFRPWRRPVRRRARDDRIVTMHETLHLEYRFGTETTGVVAGKLAERSFGYFRPW